jgi:hypothetical protein
MVDDHGAPAVDAALRDCLISLRLPKNLHEAFGPTIMPLPVAVRGVGIMPTKDLKASLKDARRQVP